MADSSGRSATSTMSWSITTDVSSKPRVGSILATDALVDDRVEVGPEGCAVDTRCAPSSVRERGPRYEPSWRHRSDLRHGCPVSRHDQRPPRLHLTENRGGIVAKLPLGDHVVHDPIVASVAYRSNIR